MRRIASMFTKGRKALISYIPVGYPNLDTTLKVAGALVENGCDMLELGVPFSDPLADGVTIQRATHHALLNGITVGQCLDLADRLRSKLDIPLALMGYLNPFLRYGLDKLCSDCRSAGVDGLIIPDLPCGELPALASVAAQCGLDLIGFLAPNTAAERVEQVCEGSSGFIYVVSVTGVTGARDSFSTSVAAVIAWARQVSRLPFCIGFGIADAEQARAAANIADGIIMGSKLIQLVEDGAGSYKGVSDFLGEVRKAIDGPPRE